jgi:molybdopterin-containing oxidoreductase family membrane subunit
MTGESRWYYYWLIICNCVVPQLMWWPKLRQNLVVVWIVCVFVNIGMWLERFVIIPMSLQINPLPAINRQYDPTIWDILLFSGTIGFFTMMMMLFIRSMPMINMFEVKDTLYRMIKRGEPPVAAPVGASAGGGE